MYVERVPNRNSPPAVLLRESYREGSKVRKRTIANLSHWPDAKVEALRAHHEKGKQKRYNPQYKKLQAGKLALAKQGLSHSPAFRDLTKQLRTLPSVEVNAPNFIRIRK